MAGVEIATNYIKLKDKALQTSGAAWMEDTGASKFYDDFLLETTTAISTSNWDDVACVGAGTAFVCSTSGGSTFNGWARGISSNTNGDCRGIFGEKWWKAGAAGNGFLVAEARVNAPAVTLMGMDFGLTDARTYAAIPVSVSATTWTTTPVDHVTWNFDTSGTAAAWQGIGTKNNADTAAVTGTAPTGGASDVLRLEINSAGSVNFFLNGSQVGSTTANAVTTTVALCPYVAVYTRTAATKTIDIDYVFVACTRA